MIFLKINLLILVNIQKSSKKGEKLLAILLDPDKTKLDEISIISKRIENIKANFTFVGGSFVKKGGILAGATQKSAELSRIWSRIRSSSCFNGFMVREQ